MQRFECYYKEIIYINGIKTCIVSQEFLNVILEDSELIEHLFKEISFIQAKKILEYLVNEVKKDSSKVFLAFAEHSVQIADCVKGERIRNKKSSIVWWEPINCYKEDNFYYHVHIRDNWFCRECKQVNYDRFIMPINEHESTFYKGTDNEYPNIPLLFKKKNCSYCGMMLQNHFI